MESWMDDLSTDQPRVHTDRTGTVIRVDLGATHLRMTVAEAVDLIDAMATVLGELPTLPSPSARPQREDEPW